MQLERHFFSVAACAITLLGLSTSASATITGTGCVMTGLAAQTAPSSVAAFNSACAGTTTGITPLTGLYTFSAPDTLSLNLPGNAPVNTGAAMIASLGGTLLTGAAAAAFSPATSGAAGVGGDSTMWDLHETNIVPGTYTVSLTHDDGIVLLVGGVVVLSSPNPTTAITNTATFTVTAGQTIDLLYDQCCSYPAVLQGTMPPEITSAVPEPAGVVLLGTLILGVGTLVRRKRSSLN